MSKEIEYKICTFCESQYKISYNAEKVSGLPKFCTFCGESWDINEDAYDVKEEDVGC